MFDVSLSEILMVCVVSCSVLGVKDSIKALKTIKNSAATFTSEIEKYFQDIENEIKLDNSDDSEVVQMIVDLEGNLQKSYDISKIMPEIKKGR